jgi:hypothetical protein
MSMEAYVPEARKILEDLASNSAQPITYADLAAKLGIAAQSAGGVLEPISRSTYEKDGVLLSVLVISKEKGMPSEEFFNQARRWGAMKDNELPQEFFGRELAAVYQKYKK